MTVFFFNEECYLLLRQVHLVPSEVYLLGVPQSYCPLDGTLSCFQTLLKFFCLFITLLDILMKTYSEEESQGAVPTTFFFFPTGGQVILTCIPYNYSFSPTLSSVAT